MTDSEIDRLIAERILNLSVGALSYCTNIAGAFELMELHKGLEPELFWNDEQRVWVLRFWKARHGISWPSAEKAPRAICLSVLQLWGVIHD